jgi:transcription elongation factor Elf1
MRRIFITLELKTNLNKIWPNRFSTKPRVMVTPLSDDIEKHWKSRVAESFPRCPLCGSESLKFDVKYGSVQDNIYCLECKAKWKIDYKGGEFKIEHITLLEVADAEKYGVLINEKHGPEFWIMMSNIKEVMEKTSIGKIRCKYCGTLFNVALDVCPYCGGER